MKHFESETAVDRLPWEGSAHAIRQLLAATAVERDQRGGTAKAERDALRCSGLLTLSIPAEWGGLGASWSETLAVARQFAQVDSSVAHVFAFHHLLLATTQLFGTPAQWQSWFQETARHQWFWGNALNPLDRNTVAQSWGDEYIFDGRKSFCSGASDSDMLIASALDANGKLLLAVAPTSRRGITVLGDWDNMGQRQTDSGSVLFKQVEIRHEELLLQPGPLSSPRACLRPLLAQLILANIYLGIGEGALAQARVFARDSAKAWTTSGVTSPSQDPYVLMHFGDFWLALESARALTDSAAKALDHAWLLGDSLTWEQRGSVAIAVAAAKVSTARAGLEVVHRMFEVTGARSTTAALRFDRYWRNLRVHTLHDPVDYKVRELGEWALNDTFPPPSFYS